MSRHKGEDAQAPGDECNGVVERSKVARVNNDPVTLLPAVGPSRAERLETGTVILKEIESLGRSLAEALVQISPLREPAWRKRTLVTAAG